MLLHVKLVCFEIVIKKSVDKRGVDGFRTRVYDLRRGVSGYTWHESKNDALENARLLEERLQTTLDVMGDICQ